MYFTTLNNLANSLCDLSFSLSLIMDTWSSNEITGSFVLWTQLGTLLHSYNLMDPVKISTTSGCHCCQQTVANNAAINPSLRNFEILTDVSTVRYSYLIILWTIGFPRFWEDAVCNIFNIPTWSFYERLVFQSSEKMQCATFSI